VRRARIVVLGAITRYPVSGIVWLTLQYVLGFRQLGYDCYYVESHGGTPRAFVENHDDGARGAAAFLARLMARFDLSDRWAFHVTRGDRRCYGLSETELWHLYSSASLIVNLHGATIPQPEQAATGRLIYIGTDPVLIEIQLHQGSRDAYKLLEPHVAFFTWAGNHGKAGCRLPQSDRFVFQPTRQPVLVDLWSDNGHASTGRFTTIAGWRQLWREIWFEGEIYHWSKHFEFLKFLSLPSKSAAPFELALTSYEPSDRALLESHGWSVLDAAQVSSDLDLYRQSPRIKTSVCVRGGSAIEARRIWRPAAPLSRRIPASGRAFRRAAVSSDFRRWKRRRATSRRSLLTTNGTAPRRAALRRSASITRWYCPHCSGRVEHNWTARLCWGARPSSG
jgi:hypothetical protein